MKICACLSLGCSTVLGDLRQDALLGAGGAQGGPGSRGSQALLSDGGGGRGDQFSLGSAHSPADFPAVGGLIAGLTRDVGGLRPWAGVLSREGSLCTSGWFSPCPWPVLLPGDREMHQ